MLYYFKFSSFLSEPLPAVTDCWAQGVVPQTFRCQPSISEEFDSVTCVSPAGKDQSSRFAGLSLEIEERLKKKNKNDLMLLFFCP